MSETPIVRHDAKPLSALTKKLGPLPGYAWVLIVVAAYYLYRKYYGGGSSTTAATATPVGTTDATNGYSSSPVDYGGGSTYAGGGLLTSPGSGISAATDNATWGQQAAGSLIAGGANAGLVNNAISDYLNGKPLSTQEQQIINQVLAQFGEPPNGVLPIIAAPTPPVSSTGGSSSGGTSSGASSSGSHSSGGSTSGTHSSGGSSSNSATHHVGTTASQTNEYVIEHLVGTQEYWDVTDRATVHRLTATQLAEDRAAGARTVEVTRAPDAGDTPPRTTAPPKPAPPRTRTYTVRSGDSLSSIASHFYGNSNAYSKIYAANRSKIGSNPNLIHPGTVLEIPG